MAAIWSGRKRGDLSSDDRDILVRFHKQKLEWKRSERHHLLRMRNRKLRAISPLFLPGRSRHIITRIAHPPAMCECRHIASCVCARERATIIKDNKSPLKLCTKKRIYLCSECVCTQMCETAMCHDTWGEYLFYFASSFRRFEEEEEEEEEDANFCLKSLTACVNNFPLLISARSPSYIQYFSNMHPNRRGKRGWRRETNRSLLLKKHVLYVDAMLIFRGKEKGNCR